MVPQQFPKPLTPGAQSIGAALLAQLSRSGALVSVKEIASGRYVWANEGMAALFGREVPGLIGQTDAELVAPGVWAGLRSADQAAAMQPAGTLGEQRIDDADGRRREFSVLRVPIEGTRDAPPVWLCAVWNELTEAHRREAQLKLALEQLEQEQKANRLLRRELQEAVSRASASAMGPYDHAQFEDQLRRELDLSAREHREFALVSVLLDPLNDAALAAGDAARGYILDALERQLRDNTRAMDALCRFGDERFTLLLSGVGLATAHSRMEGLRRQCATQIVALGGRDFGFSVSMGVASFPHTADSQRSLIEAAESALAEARRRGGNRVVLASIRFDASA